MYQERKKTELLVAFNQINSNCAVETSVALSPSGGQTEEQHFCTGSTETGLSQIWLILSQVDHLFKECIRQHTNKTKLSKKSRNWS